MHGDKVPLVAAGTAPTSANHQQAQQQQQQQHQQQHQQTTAVFQNGITTMTMAHEPGAAPPGSPPDTLVNTMPPNTFGIFASLAQQPQQQLPTAVLGGTNLLNVKDSRWLQLEVCREFQRGQCSRSDLECKFAHPPPHVEIQNGRVTACYDSIKGRCTRENPKCKYLHPPQHLKDQLLINGRNNLVLKNLLANQMTAQLAATPLSISSITAVPGTSAFLPNIAATTAYNPYAAYALNAAALYPGLIQASAADPYGFMSGLMPTTTAASAQSQAATLAAMHKIISFNANAIVNGTNRIDRVEALNSPVNKRAAVEKGGLPVVQPIYQTMSASPAGTATFNGSLTQYQPIAVPGLTASYMVPAQSIAGNHHTALTRF